MRRVFAAGVALALSIGSAGATDPVTVSFEGQVERQFQHGTGLGNWDWVGVARVAREQGGLRFKNQGSVDDRGTVAIDAGYKGIQTEGALELRLFDKLRGRAGIRGTAFGPELHRLYFVAGLETTLMFDTGLEASMLVSERGVASFELSLGYEWQPLERLAVLPFVELGVSTGEDLPIGQRSGLGRVEAGVRVRYEILPEIAPYVGVTWNHLLGGSGDLVSDAGDRTANVAFILGLRLSF
ncbi:MAG: copper resistance protein B [Alphaproteobacteria bacterium]|nr:copper resistance protein B [Alphaproteobacteria bacterium]